MINVEIKEKSDTELVRLSLDNQDNYAFIINKYEYKITKYINRLGNLSSEDVEDLIQDIFLKIYKNLNNFNPELKFSSWIYRIAHNETVNKFKKNHSVNLDFDDIDFFINKMSDCIDCHKENIENDLDNKALKIKINEIFNKMDIRYKEILMLKFIEEKDYNEISDIIKKPINTVGTLISRAKKQFKELYGQK